MTATLTTPSTPSTRSTTRRSTRALGIATAAVMLAGAGVVIAAPAEAKGGGAKIVTGNCSGATDWKLKAKARDGGLEVEFEVDSNRNGRTWSYTLRHDGRLVATGRRVTQAPSGSFSVTRRMVDAPGTHRITATAKNLRTGEVCRAAMTA